MSATELQPLASPSGPVGDGAGPFDLELRDVTKVFDNGVVAVDGFSLQVEPGELVSLLGPSGCGKTTTLRVIGGFAAPEAGQVLIRNLDVTARPPNKRDIGLVFQNYALFPHMRVADNVAYGLRMRRVGAAERQRRTAEALELVELGNLAERYPRQLSGGQQQRVALARAIVIRPSVLLLDEPLSNLDAKLRQQMRSEIRHLQQQLKITTIFVTHDQEEALTMSDRIVVMNQGRVEQVGSPRAIYHRPRTLFVARFIGEGNFLEGTIGPRTADGVSFTTASSLRLIVVGDDKVEGSTAIVSLRAETIAVLPPADSAATRFANRVDGAIEEVTYQGASTVYAVRVDPHTVLRVLRQNAEVDHGEDRALGPGARVVLAWQPEACQIIQYE